MIPLLKTWLHDLLYSPEAARLMLRSAMAFVGAVLLQVVMAGEEAMLAWTVRDWAMHLGVAAVVAAANSVKAGERNATPPLGASSVPVPPPPVAPGDTQP